VCVCVCVCVCVWVWVGVLCVLCVCVLCVDVGMCGWCVLRRHYWDKNQMQKRHREYTRIRRGIDACLLLATHHAPHTTTTCAQPLSHAFQQIKQIWYVSPPSYPLIPLSSSYLLTSFLFFSFELRSLCSKHKGNPYLLYLF
jgi:hypothetical protein